MKRRVRKWTLSNLKKEGKKYKTRKEFSLKSHSAYETARKLGVLNSICSHMKSGYTRHSLSRNEIVKIAKKYKTKIDFFRGDRAAYTKAYREGWLKFICKNMSCSIRPSGYWTLSRVKREAKKYTNRDEFKLNARGAYGAAYREDWLDILYPKKKTQN